MRARAGEAGRFLKSLCNEHRLLILCALADGEKSVGELERLLEMRQPHLSQHLTRLRADRLVTTRRASRAIYYSLGSEPAERVIGLLYELFYATDATPARGAGGSPAADVARVRAAPRDHHPQSHRFERLGTREGDDHG